MKIKQITNQYRRDFSADMKCEFCNHEEKLTSGYDDRNYHDNVVPNMKCKSCGESTISGKGTVDNTPTKYAAHQVV